MQLDDTALPCNCDPHARAEVAARGEDADELTERYARLINDAIAQRPAGMTVAIHLCRGNLKGAWMAEGGYEPIAEALFNRIEASVYCLEYDTAPGRAISRRSAPPAQGQAGDPGPREHQDAGDGNEDFLKRQIDAASRHARLEQLGIGPQCGFSSGGGGGQPITQDDTRRKLELIMEVSQEIWGNT